MEIDLWEMIKNLLPTLWQLWPFWVLILALLVIRLFFDWLDLEINNWQIRRKFKKGEAWRTDRDLLLWLRGMNPSEFEDYIADLFRRLGYEAQAVGKSHDRGVDVVVEKNGVKNYIQCKKFITSSVSVSDVRDFYGTLVDHLTNGQGYFITTNKFTLEARKFAEDKPIELIDGFKLIEYIRLAEKTEKKSSQGEKEIDRGGELCPECKGNLVERQGKFGKFLGCSNYPKCKFTKKSVE